MRKTAKKPILSIGILVSKRPDTIEKCLKSLHSLREKVACQLILVETGCGEEIMDFLREEADVLDSFEWCDDFAAARNACLKHATGEWYMFMDDDEWFENTNELEAFFSSGEYKKYGNATYRIRNYLDKKGEKYMETKAGRLAKIHPDLKFKYAIHECFDNILMPMKTLNDYEHHYGYANSTGSDEQKAKSMRNVSLLNKELAKDKKIMRQYSQLVLEYRNIQDMTKCIELSEQGISDFDPDYPVSRQSNIIHLNGLMANHLDCLARKNEREAIWKKSEEYLKHLYLTDWGKGGIYCVLVKTSFPDERYEDCMKYADEYLKMWDKRDEDDSFLQGMYDILLSDLYNAFNCAIVLQLAAASALWVGNANKAREYFARLDLKEDNVLNNGTLWKSCCQDYMRDIDESVAASEEMLETFLAEDRFVIPIAYTFRKAYEENSKKFEKPRNLWRKMVDRHWEFRLLALAEGSLEESEKIENYKKLFKEALIISDGIKFHFWDILERETIDVSRIFDQISFTNWKNQINQLFDRNPQLDCENTGILLRKHIIREPYTEYFDLCMSKMRLANPDDKKEIEATLRDIEEFSKNAISYGLRNYNQTLMEEGSDLLPEEVQVGIRLEGFRELLKAKQYAEAIKVLKDVFELLPVLGEMTRRLISYIQDMSQGITEEELDEMQELAKNIKEQARILIEQGRKAEAKGILSQLLNLVPNDGDIMKMLGKCEEL